MIREYHTTRKTVVETRNANEFGSAKRPVGRPRKTPRATDAGSFNVYRAPGESFALIDARIPLDMANAIETLYESYKAAFR